MTWRSAALGALAWCALVSLATAGPARHYKCYRVERTTSTLLASFVAQQVTVSPAGAWVVGAASGTLSAVDLASGESRSCLCPGSPADAAVRFLGWDDAGGALWLSIGAEPARVSRLELPTGALDVLWDASFELAALGEDGRLYMGGMADGRPALLVGDARSRLLSTVPLDGPLRWMAPHETQGKLPLMMEDPARAGRRLLCVHDSREGRVHALGPALPEPAPVLSPSGTRIAFATDEGIRAGSMAQPQLVRVLERAGQRALTLQFASDECLLMTVARDAGDQVRSLEVVDLAVLPAGPRALIQRPGGGPFWGVSVEPGGESALVATEGRTGAEAYMIHPDGRSDTIRLPCSQPVLDPIWSPDGTHIAFVSGLAPGEAVPYLYEGPDGSGAGILPDASSARLLGYSRDSKRLLLTVQTRSAEIVEYVWSGRRGWPLPAPTGASLEGVLWTEDPTGHWVAIVPGEEVRP